MAANALQVVYNEYDDPIVLPRARSVVTEGQPDDFYRSAHQFHQSAIRQVVIQSPQKMALAANHGDLSSTGYSLFSQSGSRPADQTEWAEQADATVQTEEEDQEVPGSS